jgi:hypothetical protein
MQFSCYYASRSLICQFFHGKRTFSIAGMCDIYCLECTYIVISSIMSHGLYKIYLILLYNLWCSYVKLHSIILLLFIGNPWIGRGQGLSENQEYSGDTIMYMCLVADQYPPCTHLYSVSNVPCYSMIFDASPCPTFQKSVVPRVYHN